MARKATGGRFNIDPAHEGLDVYAANSVPEDGHVIPLEIWKAKYQWGEEQHPFDSMARVVEGVYAKDPDKQAKRAALDAMQKLLWVPAGRIQAGAGTPNIVTLLNCYMDRDIEDSMSGIADALKDAMLTMQQGGGIGMNFSTLRPALAHLTRTGASASGPLPFMDMWDSMCQTIMSAGGRRGAMMAVMDCEHPDLIDFITAKHEKGRWTNFNVSVLITDAFLDAVEHDEDWHLGFNVPRHDGKHLFVTERETDSGDIELWYAYSKWRARDLWDLIIENTYEWSEPGVIFIDRVNLVNNLAYCEIITGTNPCGEQPLPPHGCCNLGAVNLARMVKNPFTPHAVFDYDLLEDIAAVGTRFLDNVIDVTLYPLDSQAKEEFAKRRIGVGITGLANALAQLGLRYGSPEAIQKTDDIMRALSIATYDTSIELAKERGAFPLYDSSLWAAQSPVYANMPQYIKDKRELHGIRNGVLLTIAPTGTTSLFAGNISSGLEPVFKFKAQRNVRQLDDTFKPFTVYDYGYLLYLRVCKDAPDGGSGYVDAMVEYDDLTVDDHLGMQAVCQKYIDASVSKTINCPQDITLEEFKALYDKAYELGCKGCTTYRYSEVRGAILQDVSDEVAKETPKLQRPQTLGGKTYKVEWPSENYYVTINDVADKPFEMFIHSTSSRYADWTTALSLMISAIMRMNVDISFIPEELTKVRSADDSAFVDGKYYGSLVALLGDTIGRHLGNGVDSSSESVASSGAKNPQMRIEPQPVGELCPDCRQPTIIHKEGCEVCTSCNYSRCG